MSSLKIKTKKNITALTLAASAAFIPGIALAADACNNTTTSDALKKCVQNNKIVTDLQGIVNALSAGVGLIIIAMIILGGIQYSIAGANPQATGAAKQRITNALIALFAYIFIFAFLQWLIPGGIFG